MYLHVFVDYADENDASDESDNGDARGEGQ